MTLDFAPDGDATASTLTHVRFANAAARDGHKGGWIASVNGLVATAL